MINTNRRTQQTARIGRLEKTVTKDIDRAPETLDDLVSEESRLFFHKLCLHQTELERQNEKLRLAKKELADERARYFDLYDYAPVGYCTISEKGVILEANLTAATMLGVPRELLVQQPLSQFILGEDQGLIHVQIEDNHCLSDIQVCELRMKRRDETVFWVHLSATAAQNSVGTKECRLVISDITERKRVEDARKVSEQRSNDATNLLKWVLDALPVRLFWKDLTSTYLGCNQRYAQEAGFEVPEELIGLDDYSMKWKDQADKYRREDFEIMDSGKPKLHEEELQTTPDGKQTWFSTIKMPLRNADGVTIGVVGSQEEITHRRFCEEVSSLKVELNGRGKILVMDDDNMVLNTLGTMLETLGYTVELALEGQQAVDKYAESQQSGTPFDAVVMDLIIPGGMGGREAVQRLLAVDPRAKVIVASGYSNNSVNTDYKNYGFSGVIAKPYRASELSKLIEQVLHD